METVILKNSTRFIMQNAVKTKHSLDFEVAEWHSSEYMQFRVGTVNGLWTSLSDCYVIVSIINDVPGNGHFDDVIEWFEFSSKRDNKNLLIVEIMNKRFYLHLVSKRGFVPVDAMGENCCKVFNEKAFRRMKKHGNEILQPGTLQCY